MVAAAAPPRLPASSRPAAPRDPASLFSYPVSHSTSLSATLFSQSQHHHQDHQLYRIFFTSSASSAPAPTQPGISSRIAFPILPFAPSFFKVSSFRLLSTINQSIFYHPNRFDRRAARCLALPDRSPLASAPRRDGQPSRCRCQRLVESSTRHPHEDFPGQAQLES